ncbi:Uncharacterised protein [Salmonella enterica subsp. enterica]|uniref:Uncharacterized protein n=1 Tax=Salmonella enterica I TaxID=59201 RepID=A0A447U5Q8_SALET|nr:Uncharacterised protein [Salmonella enterica subsp. enterica]
MEIVKIEMNLKAVNKRHCFIQLRKEKSQALFTQIQLAKLL